MTKFVSIGNIIPVDDKEKIKSIRDKSTSNSLKSKGSGGSKLFSSDDKRRQLERVLAAIRAETCSVSLTEINHAITTAGRLCRVNDALEIFRGIETLRYQPDVMSYNNVIWAAGNAGRVELASKLFHELLEISASSQKTIKQPNVYTYGALMHGCAKARNYKLALSYIDLMIKQDIKPNLVVFTSAIEACSESGQYKEALQIMDRMKSLNIKPDVTMINAAIKACSIAGAMEEAETLAENLRKFSNMDLFTYHTLMMGNTKLGRYYKVLELYEEALQSNAQLDGGIYSLAMLAALNSGMFSLVPKIADSARSQRVKLTEASYTTLIQSYAEAGSSELAVSCLDQMVAEGLEPNVISYAAAMAACRDKPDIVMSLLDQMIAKNITPNTVVLTTAINSLARGGPECTEKAYSMLKYMEEFGPEPNIYTYNIIIRAFAELGKLEEAMEILIRIKQRGLTPDQFTFTTLLIASGRCGTSEKVESIMQMMKNVGIIPDSIAYGAAIDAHRRSGNSAKALECLHDMMKFKIEPTASHYNLVLRALRAEGKVDKMYRMVQAISSKEDAKINSNTFELVIESLLQENNWKQSLILLQSMEKLSLKPSLEIYVSLVEQLEKARQYKAVLALYRIMARDGYDFYENSILNDIFKRLVNVAAKGVKADLNVNKPQEISSSNTTSIPVVSEVVASLYL